MERTRADKYRQALGKIHKYYKGHSIVVSCAMEMNDIAMQALEEKI